MAIKYSIACTRASDHLKNNGTGMMEYEAMFSSLYLTQPSPPRARFEVASHFELIMEHDDFSESILTANGLDILENGSNPTKNAIDLDKSPKEIEDFLANIFFSRENEGLKVHLQCIVQLAWLLTVISFQPSSTIYLAGGCEKGWSFIGAKRPRVNGEILEISIDPQEPVQCLLQRIFEWAQIRSNAEPLNDSYAEDEEKASYSTVIIHEEMSGSSSVPHPKSPPSALRLSILRGENRHIQARLDIISDQFDIRLADGLLRSFRKVFASICDNPSQPVGAVDPITPHDYELITNFTSSVSPPQNALLHDLCLRHVATAPDAPAVRSWDGNLTYRELQDLASQLSHWLVSQGVSPGIIVACVFYKSTWAIVARLAILMAGGAYLCVDAHDPPVYLESVLERTHVKIILISTAFAGRFGGEFTCFEVSAASLQALPSQSGVVCSTVTPSDPCVVLFTSGSTGTPKGIVQEHRSYASALTDYIRVMKMGPHTRMFQFDAYAFDISNNDFLAPLMAGGCCCVPTTSLSMEALMTDFVDLEANMMFVTPSVAIDIDPDRVPGLETMCLGGEPVSDGVLNKWLGRTRVVNQYGMGEVASLCAFNPNLESGKGSVIGRPATGALWVVNADNPDRLMPVGAVGEILIEGPHVSPGYLDPLSSQSGNFINDTPSWMAQLHPTRRKHRMYRSGDLGRYNHDGTIEFIGRKDSMLKLDGARIEPGQVEPVLKSLLSPGDTAIVDVLGVVDGISDPILAVFLFLAGNPMNSVGGPVDDIVFLPVMSCHAVHALTVSLRNAVARSLPAHYLPSLFLLMDRVPRTKSKKIDRRKLHALGQEYYIGRREELKEVTVWPDWGQEDGI